MSIKANLIVAKALIDSPKNWNKGEYESAPGCLCALGAVARAIWPRIDFNEVEPGITAEDRALAAALPGTAEKSAAAVADFNDDDDTTHEMIMQLFDRAIAAQDGA